MKVFSAESITRRQFFKLSAGIAVAGTAYWLLPNKTPSFEEARADKSLRKAYIDSIADSLEDLEYIREIKYCRGKNPESPKTGIELNFIVEDIGKKKKFSLKVYDSPFEQEFVTNENDFLSALVDHEIDGHAKNFHYGFGWFDYDDFQSSPGKFSLKIIQDVCELIAYGNQLEKRHQRGISGPMLLQTLGKYYEYYSDLIHPARDNSIMNKEMLHEFRKRLFLEDFLSMQVGSGRKKRRVIIPNGIMNTKYGPVKLPESIVKKYNL